MGSRLEAFFAGYQPKNTPVIVHTANDSTIEYRVTTTGQWAKADTLQAAKHPNITPMIPPVMLMMIDSIRNCDKMSRPRAPMLMRNPI